MEKIRLLLPLISIIDMSMTYQTIVLMDKINPHKNHYNSEMNPLTKWLWRKLGLKTGSIVAGTFFATLFLTYSIYIYMNFLYYFFGIFTIVLLIHFKNIVELRRLLK